MTTTEVLERLRAIERRKLDLADDDMRGCFEYNLARLDEIERQLEAGEPVIDVDGMSPASPEFVRAALPRMLAIGEEGLAYHGIELP
jgi:hypothetical protein